MQETVNLWDMAHYSEELPRSGVLLVGQSSPQPVSLDHTEAFDATEIDRMVCESERDEFPYKWTELPNIAPPFQKFFMFSKVSGDYILGGQRHKRHGGWIGALLQAYKDDSGWGVEVFPCGGTDRCHWQEESLLLKVDNDGRMGALKDRAIGDFALLVKSDKRRLELAESGHSTFDIVNGFAGIVYPFFLAISIMHCKNVTAQRVERSQRFADIRKKKGKPIYTYGVLNISPVRKLAQSVGASGDGPGVMKAMHLCRGHFKDYRDGAGLFGRTKGMFWWDSTLRGSIDAGVRVKDYRVKAS